MSAATLDERLREWGSSPAAPATMFVDELGSRLLLLGADEVLREYDRELDPRGLRSRRGRWIAGLAFALCLLAAGAYSLAARHPHPQAVIVASNGATIIGPDGVTSSARAGAVVPDEGQLTTRSDGGATVNANGEQITVGPNQQVDVAGGAVDPPREPPPSRSVDPAALMLRATHRDVGVDLAWSTIDDPAFRKWVVVRAVGADPTWPASGSTEVLMTSDAIGRHSWHDRSAPRDPEVRYRVIALDAAGAVIASSPAARVTEPAEPLRPPEQPPQSPTSSDPSGGRPGDGRGGRSGDGRGGGPGPN